jgi:hypothetical protein
VKLSVAHRQGEGIRELVHLRENILVHANEGELLQTKIERSLLRVSRFVVKCDNFAASVEEAVLP